MICVIVARASPHCCRRSRSSANDTKKQPPYEDVSSDHERFNEGCLGRNRAATVLFLRDHDSPHAIAFSPLCATTADTDLESASSEQP